MHRLASQSRMDELTCKEAIFAGDNPDSLYSRALLSIGSLGSGNHFIELDRDVKNGDIYLVIHSGSRNPGLSTAVYHQKKAARLCGAECPKNLAWLQGDDIEEYLHDMKIMQEFADLNRKAMSLDILEAMGWKEEDRFSTIHNYVNFDDMILRKGAISARLGEKMLIPFNMRDGSVICEVLGNEDWNYSAPHGAGRRLSRTAAADTLDVEDFKAQMQGIYTTSVNKNTLVESPAAYKDCQAILQALEQTARVTHVLKPIYNFKAPG